MNIKNQIVISLFLSSLVLFFGITSVSATESAWQNLNPSFESGLTGTANNCSPLTVSNGTVAAYPTCTITCNSGYSLSGSSCVAIASNGGGGGGGGTTYCTTVTYSEWGVCSNNLQSRTVLTKSPSNCTMTSDQQIAVQKACQPAIPPTPSTSTPPVTPDSNDPQVPGSDIFSNEAKMIVNSATDLNALISYNGRVQDVALQTQSMEKYTEPLSKSTSLTITQKYSINNFIVYGTPGTRILGSGERAGVVNSYKSAFGKLPTTEDEWSDVIKIANGRWPTARDQKTEANAEEAFLKIYKRKAVRTNPNDDAAVTVIAYGLRPANRNLASEKAAIKSFKAIYGYNPISATAWDIVRAIAYSGAKR
ncbi:MAG: hypothetical protein US81_C0017G0002 [Parcubacteria group bacterium GW2011_GWE2_38_18]|nr:MAG: hypothetical protein US81_C0017G0002 [Parcubacteria group bacterium GW2011_GWE2_38_18]